MADTTLGQRIAEQRKKQNLSQEAFGEKMGVSRQAISKWEADGAMPEIDKLIAMSKLFGVSVGWLLGLEEDREPPREETFSEKQLEILEELLKSHRPPQPAPQSRIPWILGALGICAALILGIVALSRTNRFPDYSGQLSNLFSNYSYVQGQLGNLAGKLEELAQGERLLTQYDFHGEALPDLSGVRLSLTATPKNWKTEDWAELSVRKNGVQILLVECEFTGSAATAQWELPGDKGIYSYCFILHHADGSQDQEILDNLTLSAQEPSAVLKLDWQGELGWSWDTRDQTLEIHNIFVHLAPPVLMRYDGPLTWDRAELAFWVDGEERFTLDLLEELGGPSGSEYLSGDTWAAESIGGYLSGGFWPEGILLKLSEGSRVEAVVTAVFSDSPPFRETVKVFHIRNGQIEEEAPME